MSTLPRANLRYEPALHTNRIEPRNTVHPPSKGRLNSAIPWDPPAGPPMSGAAYDMLPSSMPTGFGDPRGLSVTHEFAAYDEQKPFEDSPSSYACHEGQGFWSTGLDAPENMANPPNYGEGYKLLLGQYDGSASTWRELDGRAAVDRASLGAYLPASERPGPVAVGGISGAAYATHGDPVSSSAASRGRHGQWVAGAGEGTRRDGPRPNGAVAPNGWSKSPSFGASGNPHSRDVVSPGSRLDARAGSASLYSSIAGALTPISPQHGHAQRQLAQWQSVNAPAPGPARAPGAQDVSAAPRYPTGPPPVAFKPEPATDSVPLNIFTPPGSPKDRRNSAPRAPKMHQCPVCQKWFPRPGGLQTHMNSHNNVKPFVCGFPECDLRFTVQSNARRHRRNAHGAEFAQQYEDAERRQPPRQPNITFDDPVVNSQMFLEAPRQLMWLPPNEPNEEALGFNQ